MALISAEEVEVSPTMVGRGGAATAVGGAIGSPLCPCPVRSAPKPDSNPHTKVVVHLLQV